MTDRSPRATAGRLITTHRWRLIGLFLGVLAPLWLFGALAEDVWEHQGFAWDRAILLTIHRFATPARDAFFVAVTDAGGTASLAAFAAALLAWLIWSHRNRDALFIFLAIGGTAVLDLTLKAVFRRSRPQLWLSPTPEHDYGFPSGHTMGSVAVVAALVALAWPTRWRWPVLVIGLIFALAVSLSRLYLGVHFPSDVLAGWCASLAWVVGLVTLLLGKEAGPERGGLETTDGMPPRREGIR